MPKRNVVAPRILVLEGLYADTAEIIDDCGGIGVEASPWDAKDVKKNLGEGMEAVSLHHQCVADPGRGMRIAATALDGTPEAIESKDGLMLGVQFHPEMTAYKDVRAFNIFRWLVETAAMRKGGTACAVSFHQAADDYYERLTLSYQAWKREDADAHAEYAAWGSPYGDDEGSTTSTQASSPGGPRLTTRSYPPRKAGDPALPSMRETAPSQREMVQLIESSTGQSVIVTDGAGNVIDSTCEDEPFDCDAAKGEMLSVPFGAEPSRNAYSVDDHQAALELSLRICPTCHIMFDLIEDCDDHKRYGVCTGGKPVALLTERVTSRYPEMEPPPGHEDWMEVDELTMKMAREGGYRNSDWDDVDY
jgi:hypothetical protein